MKGAYFLLGVFQTLLLLAAGGILFCYGAWAASILLAALAGWCDETRKRLLRTRWEEEWRTQQDGRT